MATRDINEVLGGIRIRLEAADAEASNARKLAKEEIDHLQKGIIAGEETTGSPLHDGVLILYGAELFDDPEIIQRYEEVQVRLETAQPGDPVALVQRGTDRSFFGGPGDRRNNLYHLTTIVSMGLLEDSKLVFDLNKKEAYLPTSVFVVDGGSHSSFPPKIENGSIKVDSHSWEGVDGIRLGSDLGSPFQSHGKEIELSPFEVQPVVALEILIGRQHIDEWLASDGEYSLSRNPALSKMRALSEVLGIPEIGPATKEQIKYLAR